MKRTICLAAVLCLVGAAPQPTPPRNPVEINYVLDKVSTTSNKVEISLAVSVSKTEVRPTIELRNSGFEGSIRGIALENATDLAVAIHAAATAATGGTPFAKKKFGACTISVEEVGHDKTVASAFSFCNTVSRSAVAVLSTYSRPLLLALMFSTATPARSATTQPAPRFDVEPPAHCLKVPIILSAYCFRSSNVGGRSIGILEPRLGVALSAKILTVSSTSVGNSTVVAERSGSVSPKFWCRP